MKISQMQKKEKEGADAEFNLELIAATARGKFHMFKLITTTKNS